MRHETLLTVKTILEADTSVSVDHRERILQCCRATEKADEVETRMMTIKQAAMALGCADRTVRRYIAEGYLTAVKYSQRNVRILAKEVEEFKTKGVPFGDRPVGRPKKDEGPSGNGE